MSATKTSLTTPLKRVRGLGAAGSGTDHFWKQRLTALAQIPLTLAFVVILLSVIGSPTPPPWRLCRIPSSPSSCCSL